MSLTLNWQRAALNSTRCLVIPAVLAALLVACGGNKSGSDGAAPGSATASATRMHALAAGTAAQGGVMINEVNAANWQGATDEDGDAEDWMELYNPAATEVDLSGYGLSNNAASPFRWAFPAGQKIGAGAHLRVWLSKKDRAVIGRPLHASFNLDNGADPLILSASNATAAGITVDSATPPLVKPDHSWCRMPSGAVSSPFQICTTPTPGTANSGPAFATMLAKPTISLPSGLYAAAQTVSVSGPGGTTVRYTTDGSMPTAASPAYSTPITLGASGVLRAVAFAEGAVPSPAESATFVIDAALSSRYGSLKALFVTMEPADFTRYQNRDRALTALVNLELQANRTSLFKLDVDGSVSGHAGSLDSPQISMNVAARDALGVKDIVSSGVLWADKPTLKKVKKLRIRNGGNDWAGSRLRDLLSQDLATAGPNLTADASAVAMFVNGRYYALMSVREREDETIVATSTGADKDQVDYLETPLGGGQEIKNGGPAALASYTAAHNFIVNNDMSLAANYTQAQRLVDVTSLAWDWGHHLLLANYDWPDNNVHVFRSPALGGRWTWRPHDFDLAMGRYAGPERDMNFAYAMDGSPMFAALLRSTAFKHLFLNIAADQMNLMTPTFMNARLDVRSADMRPYINDTWVKNGLGTEANWNTNLAALRNWMRLREPFHDLQLRTQFNLGNRGSIGVTVNDLAMGSVKVNTLDTGPRMSAATPAWSGRYYPGVPVTLEARPKPGYVFVGWQGSSTATTRSITHTLATTPALPADGFAVRWSGQLVVPTTGSYRFQTIADDGVALGINGQVLVQSDTARAETTTNTAALTLTAGQRYPIVVQYADYSGSATMRLLWLPPGATEYVPVPATQLYPDATSPLPTGLYADYFDNPGFSGTPVASAIEAVDFAWGGGAPTPSNAQFEAVFAPGTPAAPSVQILPTQSARTGDFITLPVAASDANGYTLTYGASGLPKGLAINTGTGIITGRCTTPGSYTSTITVNNGANTATLVIEWTVTDRAGTGRLGTSPDSGGPPANTPPSVTLTSPAAAQTVTRGATLTLAAAASDANGSVSRVEFLDNGAVVATVTSAPYSTTWTATTAGAHGLSARATDNLGASTTSTSVVVTVEDTTTNQPPTVALTWPASNLSIPRGSTATLAATASDADGSVARVEFYAGANKIGTRTAPPYSVQITASYNSTYSITAKAFDNLGASTTSAAFTVTVIDAAVNVPPTVTLTSPAAGQVVAYGSTATLAATAADSDGSVVRVEFLAGASVLFSDTSAPYSVSVAARSPGTHTLTARAIDNQGATTVSAAHRVTVTNAGVVALPAGTTACANEGGTCALPAGRVATVYYGTGGFAFFKTGLSGSVACNSTVFGDPVPTLAKSCSYVLTGSTGGTAGLKGQYFNGISLSGTPLLTRVEAVDFNWGVGSPGPGVPADGFSVRWTGTLRVPVTGLYRFQTVSDDGVRLTLGGVSLVDNWTDHSSTTQNSPTVYMVGGQLLPVRLEYFDSGVNAEIRLRWTTPLNGSFVPVPASVLAPP